MTTWPFWLFGTVMMAIIFWLLSIYCGILDWWDRRELRRMLRTMDALRKSREKILAMKEELE